MSESYDLRQPRMTGEWQQYHAIRRRVLWERRGLFDVYDENLPDERLPGRYPFLLMYGDVAVGVVRVDLEGTKAILRRVAIREDIQRVGHGRVLLRLAEKFARENGCDHLYSFVAPDAVGFYEKCGFQRDPASPEYPDHVPMEKRIRSIRKLEPKDAELWAVLRWEALTNHPLAFGASPPGSLEELADSVRPRLRSSEESTIFGAFQDTNLIGIVGIVREAGQKERHKARIWGMYVTASHRRSGVGKSLLNAAIRQAESWHVQQVILSVTDAVDNAQRLYERRGFVPWGREPRALCVDDNYADEIHMILSLEVGGSDVE